jgi:YVTN family beta-propeller protein
MQTTAFLRTRGRWLSAVLLSLTCALQAAHAADSYDSANHQLTMPSVTVGAATYSNMTVIVGRIVSGPAGSSANGSEDNYNPATNELTVQTVSVGSLTYHNVVVTVASLVSAGGVTGADTYSGTTLTIPSVQVAGGAIYTNVVVAVAAINSPGGGMPALRDQYNPANFELTIAGIQVAGRVFTNAVITVGELLSVNGHALGIYPALGGAITGLHASGLVLDYAGAAVSPACSACWPAPTPILASIPSGTAPLTVAMDSITHKLYAANELSDNVTVVDGATNTATTVPVGMQPLAIAVNQTTNMVYVANGADGTVTVIDAGSNNATSTVGVGTFPQQIAINPVTNRIYVSNTGGPDIPGTTVTVIDAASGNSTATVNAGTSPYAIAVNTVTDKIYVAGISTGITPDSVTIIDGATNGTSSVTVGAGAQAVAIDSGLNKVYVANTNSNNVTVIDAGNSNAVTTVPTGFSPIAIAINATTHKVYVTDNTGASVTVIDGNTYGTTTIPGDADPLGVVVNTGTNQVFVVNDLSNDVSTLTVIDGVTNSSASISLPVANPWYDAVDTTTDQLYVGENAVGPDSTYSITSVSGADFAPLAAPRAPPASVPFTFGAQAAGGTVSVHTQPAGQTCSVNAASPLWHVAISCADSMTQVAGTLTGLTANGLELEDAWSSGISANGLDRLRLTPATSGFTFPTPVALNGYYDVIVLTQPNGQTCVVSGGTGQIKGPVTVTVSCH